MKTSNKDLLKELKKRLSLIEKQQMQIDSLNEKLRLVNEKLKESESLKSHFISNITNEIINPFASILGLSKNIIALDNDQINKAKSMANLIFSEAFHLDFQLINIFAAAKIEAGENIPEIVNTDINQLIKTVIDSFAFDTEKKKIDIKFDSLISSDMKKMFYFKTDPEKLQIILKNLVSNSINYSPESNKIEIKAWIENKDLNISVTDHGKGISESNKKQIFDRFKQLDSCISSINKGYGLGLSVTKSLIDILEGKIDIQSNINQGTIVTITIPEGESFSDDIAFNGNEFLFESEEIF